MDTMRRIFTPNPPARMHACMHALVIIPALRTRFSSVSGALSAHRVPCGSASASALLLGCPFTCELLLPITYHICAVHSCINTRSDRLLATAEKKTSRQRQLSPRWFPTVVRCPFCRFLNPEHSAQLFPCVHREPKMFFFANFSFSMTIFVFRVRTIFLFPLK